MLGNFVVKEMSSPLTTWGPPAEGLAAIGVSLNAAGVDASAASTGASVATSSSSPKVALLGWDSVAGPGAGGGVLVSINGNARLPVDGVGLQVSSW